MQEKIICLLLLLAATTPFLNGQSADPAQKEALSFLDEHAAAYAETAHRIWTLAEVGYQEHESTALLQEHLQTAGFKIESGVAGIPTAFVATYGAGKPVIGILAEFDALPGVSQDAVPYRQEREDCSAGHACGHHLFGAGSTAAAVAVKKWLEKNGQEGTIRLYGTPAEEGGSGKVYMVRAGLFDDADVVLHWHPGSSNRADAGTCLAVKSAKFRFQGTAAHAAGAPERGRSALDGVEAMNYMVNLLREHVPQETRIHYVITRGGEAPNVVPAFAEVYYYVRHPQMREVKNIFERLVQAAEGGARGTGTTVNYEVIGGAYNLLPNETLARLMHQNLERVGGVSYTPEERTFAEKIMNTYPSENLRPEDAEKVAPFSVSETAVPYSTDVGDVSWMAPTAGLSAATWAPGTAAHSWQAVAAGGTGIGHKGMMVAAKTIALTAIDLFRQPAVIEQAKAELQQRRGTDFRYEALLGDREPPLDYRE